jgi:hypothetical protein
LAQDASARGAEHDCTSNLRAEERDGGNQIDFDFDMADQPVDDERQPAPAAERQPERDPGAMLNDHEIWVSDLDLPENLR